MKVIFSYCPLREKNKKVQEEFEKIKTSINYFVIEEISLNDYLPVGSVINFKNKGENLFFEIWRITYHTEEKILELELQFHDGWIKAENFKELFSQWKDYMKIFHTK